MEKSSMIQTFFKCTVAAVLPLCFLSFSIAQNTLGNKKNESKERVDYAAMRQDISQFETALNGTIGTFSKGPFGVINAAKGVYLQGFGINFTFLINIQRAIINTPFGDVLRHSESPEQKKQWMNQLKETLIRLLLENGKELKQLRGEECVTVAAFIDDKNILEPSANKTIVLRALKRDLDELGNRNDRLNEFKQRIKIVEY
jgi:hypothetical protein